MARAVEVARCTASGLEEEGGGSRVGEGEEAGGVHHVGAAVGGHVDEVVDEELVLGCVDCSGVDVESVVDP